MAWRAAGGCQLRWVALVCLAGTVVAAACAAGGGNEGEGNGGSTSTSTGTAGTGGGNGGGGTGGLGGSTSSGEGGTEPPCAEDPCKLVLPQCGCGPGEKCALDGSDGTRSCEPDGTVDIAEECSGSNCKAGGLCLTWSSLSSCFKYCNVDEDCGVGGAICIMQLGEYPERFCSVNCDPPGGVGCNVPGSKCEALYSQDDLKWFTLCAMAGTGTYNADCSVNGLEDCAAGYGCFTNGTDHFCLQYCNMGAPQCQMGTCSDLATPIFIGNPPVQYGVCQ